MSLRSSLHEWVRDELNVPVYDARLPVRPNMPAVVQRFVSGRSDLSHSNPISLIALRIQFDLYSNNDTELDQLSTRLLRRLDGYHGRMGDVSIGWAGLLLNIDALPHDIKGGEVRFRRVLDFTVAYQEVR